jgi:uncharacterized protein YvpB
MFLKREIAAFLVVISMFTSSVAYAAEEQKLNILLNVPFFNQYNDLSDYNKELVGKTACGPTAAAIMLQNEGMKVDINDVLAILPNSIYQPKVGFYQMDQFASYFNKEAVKMEFSHKNIYDTLNKGKVIFLNIKNYDSGYGHAMVIVGMRGFNGETAESLIVHDVFVGPYREFKFITNDSLRQPEGQVNYINKSLMFYIK